VADVIQAKNNYDEQKIKLQVRNQFDRLVETAKSLDHKNYMKFFDSNKFTSFNEDGTITDDFSAFRLIIEQNFSSFKRYKSLDFYTVKISIIDTNTVVLMNEYTAEVILNDDTIYPAAGAGTQIWSHSSGQWKLVHVTSNHRQVSDTKSN
jgi:hypothetical protein